MYIDIKQIMTDIENGAYKYIGSGSARKVFDLKNGFVIKIARNVRGIAQNIAEYDISNDNYSNFFAKVYYISDDYKCLIMEKAAVIKNESEFLRYFKINNKKELVNNQYIKEIHDKYNLVWADLYKVSSWGKINGNIVLIDYGYTKEVYNKYYNNRRKKKS